MKYKSSISTLILTLISVFHLHAQLEEFEYQSKVGNVQKGWNVIDLPIETFEKSARSLDDIRIFTARDAVEQAYILERQSSASKLEKVFAKIINTTNVGTRYSFTFELSNTESINHVELDFSNPNFDWRVKLEGSMELNKWETILENYRILSLNRSDASFKLSNINFPESKFNYYKVSFEANQKPILNSVALSKRANSKEAFNEYKNLSQKVDEDAKQKTSVIEIELNHSSPVGRVDFEILTASDYYRPFKIEGARDSFETDKGWKYRFRPLYRGVLYSEHNNSFTFPDQVAKKLKVTIYNDDNQALEIGRIACSGPNYRLVTNMKESEDLILAFGNKEARKPKYDLTYFENKIPENLNQAITGVVEFFPKKEETKSPLFTNQWWLWAAMIMVIAILGFFSFKMIKDGSSEHQ